jgi:hypothetical protein
MGHAPQIRMGDLTYVGTRFLQGVGRSALIG